MKKQREFKSYVPNIEDIYQIYKNYTSEINFLQKTRKREIVEYRMLFIKLCKEYTDSTYASIGKFLGIDHSTVMYAEKQFDTISRSNLVAFQAYVMSENEIVDKYPYVYSRFQKQPHKFDMKEAQKSYVRRMHAFSVKLNFYKELCFELQQSKSSLKIKLNKYEKQLHQLK